MLTLTEAAEQIRTRRLSPVELTRECLARIESLDPVLNAFITVTGDLALEQAGRAEVEIAAGNYRGPLHGLPIGLKDLLDTAGVRTTAGSNQYRERVPQRDAEVVTRLKDAGAVMIGKLNMHEFAFGMSGAISAYGPTKNPRNPERITGGSSSGSGAAVAAGMCVAALGSDTSGSIRCPAALCGIVGHRPSANLLSTRGVVPLCTSFDTVGPMTRSVRDGAIMIDALSGTTDYSSLLAGDLSQIRVGVARTKFFDNLDAEVSTLMEAGLETVHKLVAQVREVALPLQGFRTIFDAEIYEYHEPMIQQSPERYDPRTLFRLQNCAGISATDYIRERRRLAEYRAKVEDVFDEVDVIVTPTTPVPAPKLAELQALGVPDVRPFEVKYLMRNTAPFSVLFWPSASVPCGVTRDGLPVGMQISARPGADLTVLRVAHAYEQATEWSKRLSG